MGDYKQRMIREHRELQERISKLAHMLEGYAEGTLTKHHDSRNVEGFKQCSSKPNHANTAATSR